MYVCTCTGFIARRFFFSFRFRPEKGEPHNAFSLFLIQHKLTQKLQSKSISNVINYVHSSTGNVSKDTTHIILKKIKKIATKKYNNKKNNNKKNYYKYKKIFIKKIYIFLSFFSSSVLSPQSSVSSPLSSSSVN